MLAPRAKPALGLSVKLGPLRKSMTGQLADGAPVTNQLIFELTVATGQLSGHGSPATK